MKKLDGQDTFDLAGAPEELRAIMAAGRRIHAATDAVDTIVCDRLGLHRSDLRCLHILKDGSMTPRDVGQQTGLTSGSVTALLDRLEGAGFIERRRSVTDRRSVEIALSPEQEARMSALYEEIIGALTSRFLGRTEAEIDVAAQALGDFAAALEDGADRMKRHCSAAN